MSEEQPQNTSGPPAEPSAPVLPTMDARRAGGKNILIFSDGTGQAGGVRPDQRLSNVYKLFRATRSGPDSPINPEEQVAFYDAGLGTDSDVGTMPFRVVQFIRKVASSATGAGITANVIDCYAAILRHYEPGDRIYLFGFSRGAYTVRCVAGVLSLCGVPTRVGSVAGYPKYGSELRRLTSEAIRTVYEHGAGKERGKYAAQREELARRFRARYESDSEGRSNVAPHFIGVFDTVAALGALGWARVGMVLTLLGILAAPSALIAAGITSVTNARFVPVFVATCVFLATGFLIPNIVSRLKIIRGYPEATWWNRWHLSGWSLRFYDQSLDTRVLYVRHALAIDEIRKAFARVKWGHKRDAQPHRPGEPAWFEQKWFAGNHSDIGGSYAEDESRLSDIALRWMVEEVSSVPAPIQIDGTKLHLFPSAAGTQHCEVASLRDKYPRWARGWFPSWRSQPRIEALGAPLHDSVLQRFALSAVQQPGGYRPYRPEALRSDSRVSLFYSDTPPPPDSAGSPLRSAPRPTAGTDSKPQST